MSESKIRQLRMARKMTLSELAAQTQTTAGYLSQLERGLVDPSLSNLRKIARALDTPLFSLIETEDDAARIIRANKREKVTFSDSNAVLEVLTPKPESTPDNVFVMAFTLEAKRWSNDERVSHNVDECICLRKGKLEVLVGRESYSIEPGDSIYIKANTPHNIYNPGDESAEGITAMSGGFFFSTVCP